MNRTTCDVCETRIDYAGSGYITSHDEEVCLQCINIIRGDRDDQSYISTLEPIRNSMGVII